MKLRTYHAYTMAEALAAVQRDLGADAVIMNTRTFTRRSMLGLRRRSIVEVVAAESDDSGAANGVREAAARASQTVTDEDREKTRQFAVALAAKFDREKTRRPVEVFTAEPEVDDDHHRPLTPSPSPRGRGESMDDELAQIRMMVGQVLARQSGGGGLSGPTMPGRLLDHYHALTAQDVAEELADEIVNTVRDELSREQLDEEASVREAVFRHLVASIPVAREPVPLTSPDSRPLTIALVGPTGVGKTTTLAKLAAMFKLHHRKRVGMVTADTYRIAAVDQLRTYANIIGLPLQVALSPAEMRQSVHRLSDCDVILVDTAGRSQNDVLRLDELKQFIDACDPHEVHLVLSSTASEKTLLREAEAFGKVGVSKVVLTKLDEAASFGTLINAVRRFGRPLSFFTTGQEVPDHIEPARAERLAGLVLGGQPQP